MGFQSKIIYAVVTPTPQEKKDNNSTKKHERKTQAKMIIIICGLTPGHMANRFILLFASQIQ